MVKFLSVGGWERWRGEDSHVHLRNKLKPNGQGLEDEILDFVGSCSGSGVIHDGVLR